MAVHWAGLWVTVAAPCMSACLLACWCLVGERWEACGGGGWGTQQTAWPAESRCYDMSACSLAVSVFNR